MKIWIAIVLSAFAVGTSAQTCSCETLKWATCEESPCSCTILVGNNEKQTLDCTKLIPKCFLMKAEMYRARKGQDTRQGAAPCSRTTGCLSPLGSQKLELEKILVDYVDEKAPTFTMKIPTDGIIAVIVGLAVLDVIGGLLVLVSVCHHR
ncbi:epithelial cell adhesion molecule [Lates japonicus]|uniref:Epithelial cell adhesion molecule n=1 Tax=Lates japonicus TaxID=270547 RepID=A0AAD3N068_LATJO|nr:epithelial cell adhesion molecule [Lates japonicus]